MNEHYITFYKLTNKECALVGKGSAGSSPAAEKPIKHLRRAKVLSVIGCILTLISVIVFAAEYWPTVIALIPFAFCFPAILAAKKGKPAGKKTARLFFCMSHHSDRLLHVSSVGSVCVRRADCYHFSGGDRLARADRDIHQETTRNAVQNCPYPLCGKLRNMRRIIIGRTELVLLSSVLPAADYVDIRHAGLFFR